MEKDSDARAKYRETLVEADRKAQEDIDKSILSLSGGGLGVSLVFLKDVIGQASIIWPWALICAWAAWGLSVLGVLLSYDFSRKMIRRGIEQLDASSDKTEVWGGKWAALVRQINLLASILFFLGVVAILVFAAANFYAKGEPNGKGPAIPQPGAAAGPPPADAAKSAR